MNKSSIYTEENIFTFKNQQYEILFDHPQGETFRVIFNDDDYDYIEDLDLLKQLRITSNAYRLLCMLEEFNDVLHEGRLESDNYIDQIEYQCQRLIEITK